VLYNASSERSAKPNDLSKKSRQDANHVLTSEDWIDCEVHFGLDPFYVGSLYAAAQRELPTLQRERRPRQRLRVRPVNAQRGNLKKKPFSERKAILRSGEIR